MRTKQEIIRVANLPECWCVAWYERGGIGQRYSDPFETAHDANTALKEISRSLADRIYDDRIVRMSGEQYRRVGAHYLQPTPQDIVDALAASNPLHTVDGWFDCCSYCGANNAHTYTSGVGTSPVEHPTWCTWRMAKQIQSNRSNDPRICAQSNRT